MPPPTAVPAGSKVKFSSCTGANAINGAPEIPVVLGLIFSEPSDEYMPRRPLLPVGLYAPTKKSILPSRSTSIPINAKFLNSSSPTPSASPTLILNATSPSANCLYTAGCVYHHLQYPEKPGDFLSAGHLYSRFVHYLL